MVGWVGGWPGVCNILSHAIKHLHKCCVLKYRNIKSCTNAQI